jgi:hypothetical protein
MTGKLAGVTVVCAADGCIAMLGGIADACAMLGKRARSPAEDEAKRASATVQAAAAAD